MKNKIFYLIIGAVCLSACSEDFLSLSPETSISSGSYFENEEHFEQALMATYERLRHIGERGYIMDEMRSDNTFFTIYPADRSRFLNEEAIAEFIDDDRAIPTTERYNSDYVGIARANTIITRLEDADIPEESKNRILGETLFLRAFFYYDLVTHYGGIPLQLVELTSEEGAFSPRNSVEEVYDQIIADLTHAIPNLPVATSFPQSGRVTRGAAKMLLAYSYMSKPMREYERAEAELKDIVNMNYALLDNYADVFDPNNKNHQESILEVQFKDGDTGQQSQFIWRFVPKTTNTEPILGLVFSIGNVNYGGWNVPTQEMVDSYEEGDERLGISVAIAEGIQNGDLFTTESVKDIVDFTPTPDKAYYYFIRKYVHPPYEREYNTNENWPIYRYADALLLLAECLVEQNKNAEALPYLNQVRSRAGLPDLVDATPENIANERRHELAFENHRWLDLIRTGKAIEVMNAHGELMKSIHGFLLPTTFNVTQERLVYPIPFRELQINSNLVQNPGY